jgi:hypothetical protein
MCDFSGVEVAWEWRQCIRWPSRPTSPSTSSGRRATGECHGLTTAFIVGGHSCTRATVNGIGGALGGPVTGFLYDWNMLPIGQQLWLQHLTSYEKFPPLQAPESYNLTQVIEQVKKANASHASD